MSVLLSVVIPTHNRSRYAVSAIRSILSINHPGLELVVTDTSANQELEDAVGSGGVFDDPRFRYIRPAQKLDMTGNHNAAVAAATGEYVCLIGDDDTITADALQAVDWAIRNGVDMIAPEVTANYAWPDFRSRHFGAGHSSRLYLSERMSGISRSACVDAAANALGQACQGTEGLPKIYHGIVRRSLLTQIRERSGAYFHGSSPDVSGAIGLALIGGNFVVSHYPVTIPGASGGSNTGRSAMNTHKGKLGQEEQTRGFLEKGWSTGVPRFFSVETVWAHAALETIARLSPEAAASFNFVHLLARCAVTHPDYRKEVEDAIGPAAAAMQVSADEFRRRLREEMKAVRRQRFWRVVKRLLRPTAAGGRHFTGGLNNIEEAQAALARHLSSTGQSWEAAARVDPLHP